MGGWGGGAGVLGGIGVRLWGQGMIGCPGGVEFGGRKDLGLGGLGVSNQVLWDLGLGDLGVGVRWGGDLGSAGALGYCGVGVLS